MIPKKMRHLRYNLLSIAEKTINAPLSILAIFYVFFLI